MTQDGTYRKVKKGGYADDGNELFEDADGKPYKGKVVVSEHGRRKGDTEMFEYVDKNGETKLKRGITYNPVLKMYLVGRLADCLLRA